MLVNAALASCSCRKLDVLTGGSGGSKDGGVRAVFGKEWSLLEIVKSHSCDIGSKVSGGKVGKSSMVMLE